MNQTTMNLDEPIAPRKGWLAVVLSLSAFGLGQFYNGQWHRGLCYGLLLLAIAGPMTALVALVLPASAVVPALAVLWFAFLIVWLLSHWQAWRTAKQLPNYRLLEWQKIGVYVLMFLLINTAVYGATYFVRDHWVRAFHIPSGSMEPTLMKGDVFFADMRVGCATCSKPVTKGDMVVFHSPKMPGVMWVKRVVALEGDPIPGKEALTVPAGHMFVMGDNRGMSLDSRSFGAIDLTSVVGKVRQIVWSRGEDGVRWSRLGVIPK